MCPSFLPSSEESKPDSDLDEPWIMTVKGLHNLHNNMKVMEETVITTSLVIQHQNGGGGGGGGGTNNNVPGGRNQSRSPPSPNKSSSSPPSALIDNNFSRKQQELEQEVVSAAVVQLRERELTRSGSVEERRASKEVGFCFRPDLTVSYKKSH